VNHILHAARPVVVATATAREQLAAVLRWARAAGWTRETGPRRGWVSPDGTVVELDVQEIGIHLQGEDGTRPAPIWCQAVTVAQGIEQLVTLGLLPPEVSPVYTAGWGAGARAARLTSPRDAVLAAQADRLTDLARLLARVQVAAWCLAVDDQIGLRTVREVLAAAGYGDPAAELVAAHAEAGLTVGGPS